MRILLLDIETSPNKVWTFDLWQTNIGPEKIIEPQRVLSYAAKWLGDKHIEFSSVYHNGEKKMLKGLHKLLDEADVVVHYYGARFDIPMINAEFIKHGFLPPSPFKQIDLKKVVKDNFRFPNNKLVYVVKILNVGEKLERGVDIKLWIDCMKNDPDAWELMKKYNIQDTNLLEGLYLKLRPWIRNHPNQGAFSQSHVVCPNCGGKHHQRRGYSIARLLRYARFQCTDCGKWFRSNHPEPRIKTHRYVET